MKKVKFITMAIFALFLFVNFSSCSSDDENSENGVVKPSTNRKIKSIKSTYPLYDGSVYYDVLNPTWDGNTMTSFISGNGEEPIERDRMTIEYGDDNEALIFDGGDPDRIILDENGYAKTAFFGSYRYYIFYNSNGQMRQWYNDNDEYCVLTYDNNGDIIQQETSDNMYNGYKYFYTNDKVKTPIENKGGIMLLDSWGIMWDWEYYYWFGIYGKSTKHLPVQVGDSTFDWTLDEQGYPIKCIEKNNFQEIIYDFEWE